MSETLTEPDSDTDTEAEPDSDTDTEAELNPLREHIMYVFNCNDIQLTKKFNQKGGVIRDNIGCGIQSLVYLQIIDYKSGQKIITDMETGLEEWGTSFQKLLSYISVVSSDDFYEKIFQIETEAQMVECMEFINNGLDNNECTIVRYNRLSDAGKRHKMCGQRLTPGHSAIISKNNDKLIFIDPQEQTRTERFNDKKFLQRVFKDMGCYVGLSIPVKMCHEKIDAQINTLSDIKLEESLPLLSSKKELESVKDKKVLNFLTSIFKIYSSLKIYNTQDLIYYYKKIRSKYDEITDEKLKKEIKVSLDNIREKLKKRKAKTWRFYRKSIPIPEEILNETLGGKKSKKSKKSIILIKKRKSKKIKRRRRTKKRRPTKKRTPTKRRR